MKKQLLYVLSALTFVLVVACSRGEGFFDDGSGGGNGNGNPHVYNAGDTTYPVVEIYTPVANQSCPSGNNISITGKITDDLGLYRGTIKVTNDANGEVLKQQQYEIHGFLSYNYTVNYTPQVSAISNYTVTVSFEDHGLNSTTQSVSVKVNP